MKLTLNVPSWSRMNFPFLKLICLAVFCAGSIAAQAQAQFLLPLDEGAGTNITDSAGGLSGPLGLYLDPVADMPFISADDAPSGVSGDNSLKVTGNGYLMVDDRVGPVLDITNGPITIEAWVFLRTASPGSTLWEGIARYGGSYKLGMRGRNLAFTLFGKADIFSGRIIPANQWIHVAAVWTPGTGVTFYTNGVPNSVANTNTAARPVFDNFLTVAFEGPSSSATPRALPGSVDRVRIHHAALTSDQIDSDAANLKPVTADTIVAYHFDETALPAQNSASAIRPAIPAHELLPGWSSPAWTSDSPTGLTNDFALDFSALVTGIIPQSATVLDPLATIAPNGTNGDYTLEAWIKVPTNFPSSSRRTIFQYQGTPGFVLSLNTDRTLHTTAYNKIDQVSSALVTNDNAWHHVAVVHEDGVQFRFYVDGVLGDTRAYTLGAGSSTLTRFTIGSGFNGALPFIGKMDRLRFSNRALAPGEFDFPAISTSPALAINRVNSDIVISWPNSQPGFALEASAILPAIEWLPVSHQETNGQNTAVIPASGTNMYYRLRK